MTDFENAAFAIFIVLLTRVLKAFDCDVYVPLSLVDANMTIAHKRNASREHKFWFRRSTTKLDCTDGVADATNYEVLKTRSSCFLFHYYFTCT